MIVTDLGTFGIILSSYARITKGTIKYQFERYHLLNYNGKYFEYIYLFVDQITKIYDQMYSITK